MSADLEWLTSRYPKQVTCGFCGQTLTIALKPDSTVTETSGHAAGCVMR